MVQHIGKVVCGYHNGLQAQVKQALYYFTKLAGIEHHQQCVTVLHTLYTFEHFVYLSLYFPDCISLILCSPSSLSALWMDGRDRFILSPN